MSKMSYMALANVFRRSMTILKVTKRFGWFLYNFFFIISRNNQWRLPKQVWEKYNWFSAGNIVLDIVKVDDLVDNEEQNL